MKGTIYRVAIRSLCALIAGIGIGTELGHHTLARVHLPAIYEKQGLAAAAFDIADANARLIAAAPDLYEALEALITEIRAYSSPECDDEGAIGAAELKQADAALAKARGEPS